MAVTITGSAGVTTNSGAVYDSLQSATAQASTSGTSIDFTSIPSWVKRITVMCSGVSLSASADLMFQIGSGSVTTSGYSSTWGYIYTASSAAVNTTTSGIIRAASLTSSTAWTGSVTLTLLTGNTWTATAVLGSTDKIITYATGVLALGGTLDRVRVTSSSGTDTFDAGSINILYE